MDVQVDLVVHEPVLRVVDPGLQLRNQVQHVLPHPLLNDHQPVVNLLEILPLVQ